MMDLRDKFLRDGWVTFDLAGRELVEKARRELLSELRRAFRQLADLESYHRQVTADDEHIAIQKRLFDWFVASGLGPEIIAEISTSSLSWSGADLHVQARPYLRIARPEKPQDNVNVHRDTHYGGTPYELSVHMPFTDCGLDGSLGVISGSHLEADFGPTLIIRSLTRRSSADRSNINSASPTPRKSCERRISRSCVPPVRRWDRRWPLAFPSSTGRSSMAAPSRAFRADVRVVNSFAPIDWERNEATGDHRPLSRSPVTEAAQTYYRRNAGQDHAMRGKASH